jgi:ABC-2 type transport system ATP-binding protein
MNPTVAVSHLAKSFGSFQAVKDVSFEVYPGEIFGLLGPNGAGKTTSIRMLLDIFKPDARHRRGVRWCDDGGQEGTHRLSAGGARALPGPQADLDPGLPGDAEGLSEAEAHERLEQWLERLDLREHRNKKVQELSRGMQQKAQIITTLIHDPDLLVVDEPFSGLDPVNTRLVKDIIEEQRQAGKAIIMSTHQMYQVEALCNRIVLIDEGNTVLYGEVNQIKRQFAGNAITLVGQGDFEGLPGVLETRRQNSAWHLALATGTSPQDVFQALARREGVVIERFEVAEPSLDDIFIRVVSEEREPPQGAAHA